MNIQFNDVIVQTTLLEPSKAAPKSSIAKSKLESSNLINPPYSLGTYSHGDFSSANRILKMVGPPPYVNQYLSYDTLRTFLATTALLLKKNLNDRFVQYLTKKNIMVPLHKN